MWPEHGLDGIHRSPSSRAWPTSRQIAGPGEFEHVFDHSTSASAVDSWLASARAPASRRGLCGHLDHPSRLRAAPASLFAEASLTGTPTCTTSWREGTPSPARGWRISSTALPAAPRPPTTHRERVAPRPSANPAWSARGPRPASAACRRATRRAARPRPDPGSRSASARRTARRRRSRARRRGQVLARRAGQRETGTWRCRSGRSNRDFTRRGRCGIIAARRRARPAGREPAEARVGPSVRFT